MKLFIVILKHKSLFLSYLCSYFILFSLVSGLRLGICRTHFEESKRDSTDRRLASKSGTVVVALDYTLQPITEGGLAKPCYQPEKLR